MLVVKTTSPATSPSTAKLQPSKTAPSSRTNVARLRPSLRTCSKLHSSPVVNGLSANYSTHNPTIKRPPDIRGVGRAAGERASPYRPLFREVDEREICRRSDGQAPCATDPPARGAAHRLDEPSQSEPSTEHEVRVECGEGRLVAEEAWRGLLQRKLLLFRSVGRVIRRDEIEDAFAQGPLDAASVALWSERRVDAIESFERGDEIFRQREVVGCRVGGDVGTAVEEADEGGREGRGDVGYVHLRPGLGGEDEGRRRGRILRAGRGARKSREGGGHPVVHHAGGERVVLAVQDHGQTCGTRVEHTVPENARRSGPQPIVGDAERSCPLEEAHLRQPLAGEPHVE